MSYQPPEDVTPSKRVIMAVYGLVGILAGLAAVWFCVAGLIAQGHWLFVVGALGGAAAIGAGCWFVRLALRSTNSLR